MARSSEHSSARANLVLSGENWRQKLLRLSDPCDSSSEGGSGRLHLNETSVARANMGLGLGMVPALDLDWFEVQTSAKHLVMRNDANMDPIMWLYGISMRLKGGRILNYQEIIVSLYVILSTMAEIFWDTKLIVYKPTLGH